MEEIVDKVSDEAENGGENEAASDQEPPKSEKNEKEEVEENKVGEAEPTDVEEVMKASENAIEFLRSINREDLNLCIFKDELVTLSEDQSVVGEFNTSVEKVTRAGEELLLIHASSHGKVDDAPMGTTITCYAKMSDLSLVEQQHFEYVKVRGHELEKRTEMRVDPETGSLQVNRQVTEGGEKKLSDFTFEADRLEAFVTEGTNILLQRLLIWRGLQEEHTFLTVDADSGQLVQTTYRPLPERQQKVGQKELQVYGIERSLMSIWDLPYTWQSFFMEDGHLTMRVQVGSPAVVVVRSIPILIRRAETEIKPVFEKKPLVWEEDMEMNSRFLQRKEELKAGHDSYLREHPEARALLADFFQFLLLRRPDDVVAFAAEFFADLSSVFPDSSSYKHSATDIDRPRPEA